jgi:drug/metabolite transporter (DMT)-like permease
MAPTPTLAPPLDPVSIPAADVTDLGRPGHQTAPETRSGHLAMLGFSALVAGSFSLGVMAANQIAPEALTAARFALAAGLMAGVALAGPGIRRVHLQAPWRYFLLGGTFAIYFVLMFEGLKTAPAITAAAVFTLTPAMTAAFGWLILRQVTTPRMALALAIGAAGALWVIFDADPAHLASLHIGRGEAVYFVGCIAHAAFTPLVRLLNRGEPAATSTALVMAAGCVLLLGWGWRQITATDWTALPAIVWITLVYVAIIATAATFVLLQYATLRLPSAKVMAYTYLVPSWVILWELALGRTPPPVLVLGGVGLTILALAILLKDETRA